MTLRTLLRTLLTPFAFAFMLITMPVAALADWYVYLDVDHAPACLAAPSPVTLMPAANDFRCAHYFYDNNGDGQPDLTIADPVFGPPVVRLTTESCTVQFDDVFEGAYYLSSVALSDWRLCIPPPPELYNMPQPLNTVPQSITIIIRASPVVFNDGFEAGNTSSWTATINEQ